MPNNNDIWKQFELGEEFKPYEIVPLTPTAPIIAPESQRVPLLERLRQKPLETIAKTPIVRGAAAVGRFLGMEPLGKGIAATIGQIAPEKFQFAPEEIPTAKQVIGSAALTGLTAVAPGLARYQVPFATGTKGLATLRSMELGAQFGAAHAMSQGKDTDDIVKEAITSSLLAAPLPAIGAAFSAVGKGIKGLPERFYSQIFKATKDDLELQLRTTAAGRQINPTLAKEMVDRGIVGSSEGMAVYSLQKVNQTEAAIQRLLPRVADVPIPINRKQTIAVLGTIRDGYKEMLMSEKQAEATKLINSLKTPLRTITPEAALNLRRFIDEARNQSSFKLHPTLSLKQGAYKAMADDLRKELRNKIPEFASLIKEESIFLNAFEALLNTAVKQRNVRLINLTDVLLGGGGLATGFPGAGFGAMAGVRLFQAPPILTRLGQLIEQGIVKPGEAITPAASEILRRLYYQTIK